MAWEERDYQSARSHLLGYRKTLNGRRPDVDFMLGTSGCRVDGKRDWGGDVLDWMLYAYALTAQSREIVRTERDLCRAAVVTELRLTIASIVEERAAGMTGYGKTFYWPNAERLPVASYPIRRIEERDKADFLARLVPVENPGAAKALGRNLMPGANVAADGHVLLVSTAGHSDRDLEQISETLNRYIGFLHASYGIRPPDHFMTIYLMADNIAVREAALTLHGLDVSRATVGYAFVDDASVVAYVPDTAVGTVLHELFHLMVRAEFGDIPQWLDEGMAALYEVSGRRGNIYFGMDNWRGEVLRDLWHLRPDIDELIRSEWFLFDDPEQAVAIGATGDDSEFLLSGDVAIRQAANMATARYFALYLEQEGKLGAVLRAMRERGFEKLDGPARDHAVSLVEEAAGLSVDEFHNSLQLFGDLVNHVVAANLHAPFVGQLPSIFVGHHVETQNNCV